MKKRIIYTTLTLLWMFAIFLMSAQTAEVSGTESTVITVKILGIFIKNPSPALIDNIETLIRKLCHFSEYAILCILLYKTLCSYGIKGKKVYLCVFIAFLYALSDEIHQYFVPGRACRFYDIIIDTAGSYFGYLIVRKFKGNNSQ